jgi:FkbM family methyltransferase
VAIIDKYFSQYGQDKFIVEDLFNYRQNGYFLDLAAGDGIYLSNTYVLEKYLNWKGICIEAHDKVFEMLKDNRTCICEHVCVDGKQQKVKFSNDSSLRQGRYDNNNYLGGIIDVDTDKREDLNKNDFVWKETVTLKGLLEKHNAPKVIDYFSLDVEGAELRILEGFPFDEYTFLSMSVERPGNVLHEIFRKNNYLLVNELGWDRLYVHKSLMKTFSVKKKYKLYFHLYLHFFTKKVNGMIYYLTHPLEIPSMIKRKFSND